jgi:hypothetical protein
VEPKPTVLSMSLAARCQCAQADQEDEQRRHEIQYSRYNGSRLTRHEFYALALANVLAVF